MRIICLKNCVKSTSSNWLCSIFRPFHPELAPRFDQVPIGPSGLGLVPFEVHPENEVGDRLKFHPPLPNIPRLLSHLPSRP